MAHLNPEWRLHLIVAKRSRKIGFLRPHAIIYIKGNDGNTTLFTNDPTGKEQCFAYTVSKGLCYFKYLEAYGFMRVHQSFMINTAYLLHVDGLEGVIMNCNWRHEYIPVGVTYKPQLKEYTQKPPLIA